ncbi:MAG TPA: ABC transporter permease [Vicinamibacterales bacterium]|nr:ABC transporter permease [Vicinamibacterales bacterium]
MWRWFYAIRARLRAFVGSERSDRDLNDELSFHVAMQTHANEARGMTSVDAERRARIALEGVQQLKERLHDQRSIPWFDHLRQDVTFAVRMIFRTKVVSLAVIMTFALGIGANTAIFSLIDSVLLSPLPYDSPDRIVTVEPFWTNTGQPNTVSSAPDFRDWRERNHVFEYMAFHSGREVRIVAKGTPIFASVQLVTPDFFKVFGVQPLRGRVWTEAEERTPLAVVSHAWASGQFGDAAAAIGEKIETVGQAAEIIGVAPPSFTYPGSTDIWLSSTLIAVNSNRGGHNYFVVGKLAPDVTIEEARADMRAVASHIEQEYPENRFKSVAVTPMLDNLTGRARTTLWLLFGTVIGVMLIACVNVAHLQLARAAARGREMAVRTAIGGGPGRLTRQVLTENVVLGLAGCLVGLLFGWFTLQAFLATAPADIPRLNEVQIDGRVLLFTLVVTALCSLLFGVGPARRAARADVSSGLRHQAARSTVRGIAPHVRSTLVMVEVALSLVLLVASGLLLRSFVRLSQVDLGFTTERVLVTTTSYPVVGPAGAAAATGFYRDLLAQLRTLPGVRHSAGVMTMPFDSFRANSGYSVDGGPSARDGKPLIAELQVVTPGYFETVNTPIRVGRDFEDSDLAGRPQVAIVNERLAREEFGTGDPLGRTIQTGMTPESRKGMRIIGVVADARQRSPETPPRPEIFLPYLQHPGPGSRLTILTQTSLDPGALTGSIHETARKLNPGVPIRFSTMDEVLTKALAYPRFRTTLVAAFGLLAGLLALIGIYSVLSYLVAEQTPEIGVRLALGALRRDIFRRVIGGSMRLVLGGVIVGLVIALIVVRAMEAMLFDVSPRDPITIVAVVALLAVTALTASSIPALRAASVDPLVALRDE